MPLNRWIWVFQIDLARSYFLLKKFPLTCAMHTLQCQGWKQEKWLGFGPSTSGQFRLSPSSWVSRAQRKRMPGMPGAWFRTPLSTIASEGGTQAQPKNLCLENNTTLAQARITLGRNAVYQYPHSMRKKIRLKNTNKNHELKGNSQQLDLKRFWGIDH